MTNPTQEERDLIRKVLADAYEADDMAHVAAMIRAGGDGHMGETAMDAMLTYGRLTREADEWRSVENPPEHAQGVLLYVPDEVCDDARPGQDYRLQIGYWDGSTFFEQGTGHDFRERLSAWGGDGGYPTHWRALRTTEEGKHLSSQNEGRG